VWVPADLGRGERLEFFDWVPVHSSEICHIIWHTTAPQNTLKIEKIMPYTVSGGNTFCIFINCALIILRFFTRYAVFTQEWRAAAVLLKNN